MPKPDPITAPYWNAVSEGRLALPRCDACGRFHFYPRARCPFCGSDALQWEIASGTGTIYSYTTVFQAPSPEFAGELPYTIGLVSLEEGPHMMATLVGIDSSTLAVGRLVRVEFRIMGEAGSIPVFRPVGGTEI